MTNPDVPGKSPRPLKPTSGIAATTGEGAGGKKVPEDKPADKRTLLHFGLLWMSVLLLWALYHHLASDGAGAPFSQKLAAPLSTATTVALIAAAGFALVGWLLPRLLGPFYRLWMRFAALLGMVNTRVLLTVFYYLVLTPIGLLFKLTGKELLKMRPDEQAKSYWQTREPAPFEPARYKRMF